MKKPNRYSPILKRTTHLFCFIIGVTFIFSGFIKAVDPWGTAIKFEEYFAVYGLDFLMPLSKVLAIWLCGAEMMMGCMIFCRFRLRLISIFALVSMTLFTFVTFMSVTFFPVEDCGCFGDAFHLTPWQTLIKNLIILPMVFTIWWRYRPDRILVYKPREVILATLFCIVTMSFSAYNYFHLPMIDFLPYKVGVDLLSEVESTTSDMEYSVVLIYQNIATGELREFDVEDSEWHDEQKWEWVETRTNASENSVKSYASDFALTSTDGESVAASLLSIEGNLNIITIANVDKLSPRCQTRVERYIKEAEERGDHTVVATAQQLRHSQIMIGEQSVECYNIDPTTLNTLMRFSVGVVELQNGVITSKRSCIDL